MKKVLILMDMPLFPYRIYAYNSLANRGYDLTVVSVSNEEKEYTIPLNFKHIRLTPRHIGPLTFLESFPSFYIKDYDCLIVAPNLRVLNFYKFYTQKYRSKLIGWGHHKGCTTGNPIAAWVRFHLLRKFKALVFYDYATCKSYADRGFDKEQLFVANNTQYVDLSTVQHDSGRDCFLYVGRIQERKKIDLAIDAFSLLKHTINAPALKFRIVGGGNNSVLREKVEELGLTKDIEFIGATHDEDKLAELFNSAIAYVSPGHVGLGVLHSLAFGVPVITCQNRSHSVEIANCLPSNSFVVPFDAEAISEAMKQLCQDKGLWEKMSYNAHTHYVENCTIDKMVDGIENAVIYVTTDERKNQRN